MSYGEGAVRYRRDVDGELGCRGGGSRRELHDRIRLDVLAEHRRRGLVRFEGNRPLGVVRADQRPKGDGMIDKPLLGCFALRPGFDI